jgi:dCMP deaminase
MMNHWDKRFLDLASHGAGWSKDPSTKVGAVIVRPDKTVASIGFNGLPRGVEDSDTRLHDRQLKYPMTVHAEVNAILHAREPLHGYTIYVAPLNPCSNCAAAIIQSGIKRVMAMAQINPRWEESNALAQTMFEVAGVSSEFFALEMRD